MVSVAGPTIHQIVAASGAELQAHPREQQAVFTALIYSLDILFIRADTSLRRKSTFPFV